MCCGEESLVRRPATIFLLMAVVLGLSIASMYAMGQYALHAQHAVARQQRKIIALSDVLSTVKDAETGQRGYLLVGEDAYLQPFHSAVSKLGGNLKQIDVLAAENVLAPEDVAALKQLVEAKVAELNKTIDLRRTQGPDAATAAVRSQGDLGKKIMDDIRALDGRMMDQEYAELRASEPTVRRVIAARTVLSIAIALINLAFIAWCYRKLARESTKVAEQGERLRTTLASIGDGVIATDTQGRVTLMNPVSEALTGWTTADARGQPLADVFRIVNETTRADVENPALRALREGVIVGLANHTILIAKDGAERAIDDSAAPIRSAIGELVGCVLVFRDVGEQRRAARQLAESEVRKTAMFQAALDCIITIDHQGTIIEFNPAAEQTFGHRRDDVLGKELASLIIPPAYRERHRQGLARYLATGEGPVLNQRLELSALRADGSEFPVELTVTRIAADGPPLFTAYLRDITARHLAEAALRESNERVTNIVESITDAFVTLDKEWRFTFLNQRAKEILFPLQKTGESFLGKNLWQDIPDLIGTPVEENYRRCVNERVTVGFELFYPPLHGWFEVRAYPAKDGISIYFQDITGRKRTEAALRESDDRMRLMADAMPQLAWMANPDGFIHWYNRGWYEYTGTTPDEMQGWGWQSVHDPNVLPDVMKRWTASIASGHPFEMTFPLRGEDGRFRFFLTRVRPLKDQNGNVLQWFGTNTDITEQLAAEENLLRAKEAAETAGIAKDNFLATLSHELRTPLTPVLATLGEWENAREFPPELQEDLQMVRRNVDLEARLIDDLLDLTRIVKGKIALHLEVMDVQKLLDSVVGMYQSEISGKKIDLSLHPAAEHCHVRADPGRLQQAFWNLLKNAVKFTPEGGRIDISTRNDAHGHIQIIMTDTGIGISPEMIKRLFTPFEQETASRYGGLGLGLAITKTLVGAQDGQIEAKSDGPGRGATFIITLPCVDAPAPPDPASSGAKGGVSGDRRTAQDEHENCYRVLLVEDHADTARVLARLLRGNGHEVSTAYSVAEALAALRSDQFDVLVSDIGLPDGTGLDLIREARQQYGTKMPAVALTGFGMEDDVARTKEAGFNSHLTKPVNFARLEQTIQQACKGEDGIECPS